MLSVAKNSYFVELCCRRKMSSAEAGFEEVVSNREFLLLSLVTSYREKDALKKDLPF